MSIAIIRDAFEQISVKYSISLFNSQVEASTHRRSLLVACSNHTLLKFWSFCPRQPMGGSIRVAKWNRKRIQSRPLTTVSQAHAEIASYSSCKIIDSVTDPNYPRSGVIEETGIGTDIVPLTEYALRGSCLFYIEWMWSSTRSSGVVDIASGRDLEIFLYEWSPHRKEFFDFLQLGFSFRSSFHHVQYPIQ